MRKFFRKIWAVRGITLKCWLFLFLISFAAQSPNHWSKNLWLTGIFAFVIMVVAIIFAPKTRTK